MSPAFKTSNSIYRCPLYSDPWAYTAKLIWQKHGKRLPKLDLMTLLVPNTNAVKPMQDALFAMAQANQINALLGPEITTLENWLYTFPMASNQTIISSQVSLAILVSEIKKFKWLYGDNNPWHFAEDLLSLFEDLSQNRIQLPGDKNQFFEFLSNAYQSPNNQQAQLIKEANLVYTLWKAWQQELETLHMQEPATAYASLLQETLSRLNEQHVIYMIAYNQLLPIEEEWISQLIKRDQLKLILYGKMGNHPYRSSLGLNDGIHDEDRSQSSVTNFFSHCFDYKSQPLIVRLQDYGQSKPDISPITPRIRLLPCNNAENHALSVFLAVKQALLKGQQTIGVISEDRRLTRRVRAMLERENIPLNDISGWALSTTHACTVIENWLQCIEEDFPQQAFLDLLKSHFITYDQDSSDYLKLIYRFEQDIILHENISSGIDRYIEAIQRRASRQHFWAPTQVESLLNTIKKIRSIANSSKRFVLSGEHRLIDILSVIQSDIDELGLAQALYQDPAGKLIIELIGKLLFYSKSIAGQFSWLDFRTWFGRILESSYFSPPATGSYVQILNLEQSYLLCFDCVILAAADSRHLPGSINAQVFFNERVRHSLGLSQWKDHIDYQAFKFRALLEKNENTIISWQSHNNGEPIAVCPWVKAIENYHIASYQHSLVDQQFIELIQHYADVYLTTSDDMSLAPHTQPKPINWKNLLANKISVSAYQRLVNCPYQFYANDLLSLKPSDEIQEVLKKSDYGNRVHLCLHAFYSGSESLPGPFPLPITESNYPAAIELLTTISKQVFAKDIEDNFQHRSWLNRWLAIIPKFIEYELKRPAVWLKQNTEHSAEQTFNNISIYGRIDRVDRMQDENHLSLIDYKTGTPPSTNDITSGEDIQLSCYALMLENTGRIEYLQLNDPKKLKSTVVEQEALHTLKETLYQRTLTILNMLEQTHPLPAWPDKNACSYCDFDGLCRYPSWEKTLKP